MGDVDAHQRRRHDPEHRERRVAAADLGLAREDGPEAALVRKHVEVGAGVGDRRELRAAAAGPLPEVLQVGARLDRRARLRGGEEERLLEVDGCARASGSPRGASCRGRGTTRRRTSAAAPPGASEEPPMPEQHAVVELLGRRLREGVQLVERGHGRAGRRRASRASDPRPSRSRAKRRSPRSARRSSSRRGELGPLGANPVEQLLERVGELLDALRLERLDDVVVVDADLGQPLEQLLAPRRLPR